MRQQNQSRTRVCPFKSSFLAKFDLIRARSWQSSILAELVLVRQSLLDPEHQHRLPLVEPGHGFEGLDLVGEGLRVLVLDVLAQSLHPSNGAARNKSKNKKEEKEKMEKSISISISKGCDFKKAAITKISIPVRNQPKDKF